MVVKAAGSAFPRGPKAAQSRSTSDGPPSARPLGPTRRTEPELFGHASHVRSQKKSSAQARRSAKAHSGAKTASEAEWVGQCQPLTFRQLSAGQVVLAAVVSVEEYQLKITLPGRLPAQVKLTRISRAYTRALKAWAQEGDETAVGLQPLTAMFRPGQPVLAAVVSVDQNERGFYHVEATLYPEAVHGGLTTALVVPGTALQCAVKSVEDHGYILESGLTGPPTFLSLTQARQYEKRALGGRALSLGELVPVVASRNQDGQLTLSADPARLAKATVEATQSLSLHALLPGVTLSATVQRILESGVRVQFGDSLSGYVTRSHLPASLSLALSDPIEVTVLYILPTVNTVFLSAYSHLRLGPRSATTTDPLEVIKIGATLSNVPVSHCTKSGLTLTLPHGFTGVVPTRHAQSSASMKTKYPVGIRVTCRVIQFDWLERAFLCSTDHSVIHQSVLQLNQLEVGAQVNCTVKEFTPTGLKVQVGKHVHGFIPSVHLSDVPLKHPERKFLPGTKIPCKVLSLNTQTKQLFLTAKSILVNEDFVPVSEFDVKFIGTVTEGVVAKISNAGMLLELFGGVKGWVPKSQLSAEPIEYPEKLFFIGQALKCKVLEVKPEAKRIILTLILGGHHKPLGSREKKAAEKLRLCQFYPCQVTQIKDDGLAVDVTESPGTVLAGFIPKLHLTDHPVVADALLKSYAVGDHIPEALCFERDVLPILSLKPILMEAVRSKTLPQSFEDLQEGVLLPGVVCLIKNYGVFLRLPIRKMTKSALVPMRTLSDFFVEDANEVVELHQTVYGKVIERDEAQTRLTMSTKVKDVKPKTDARQLSATLMASLLDDLERIKTHTGNGNLVCFKVGTTMSAEVKRVTPIGVEVNAFGTRGIITSDNLPPMEEGATLEPGDSLNVTVLNIDCDFECLELTALPEFTKKVKKSKKQQQADIPENFRVNVTIAMVKTDLNLALGVVRNGPFHGRFIHIPTRSHINDFLGFADQLKLGGFFKVIVKQSSAEHTIGVLESPLPAKKRLRAESLSQPIDETKVKKARHESESKESLLKEVAKSTETNEPMEVPADPGFVDEFDPWAEGAPKQQQISSDPNAKALKTKTHLSKKEKKALDKLEALEIAKAEQRVLDGEEAEPETAEEFDRLVLASPNSSLCWIKYMAFYMTKGQPEQAREIVRRALEKINFREDEEKFNIYMAWLNLENTLGDEEKFEEVFSQALKFNDQYKVYLQGAKIHEESGNKEQAEKLLKTLVRKFSKEPEAWQALGLFYFKQNDFKEARFTLQRSIQNLDKKQHLEITTKFAQFEFKHGEAERGKTLFETIVGNYPRRVDLWNVYVDLLVKHDEKANARVIFERMIQLNLQPKRMKSIFKKYIEFEEQENNPQAVDQIRKKALEYVEAKVGNQIQKSIEKPENDASSEDEAMDNGDDEVDDVEEAFADIE
ncbi:hypothetical protein TCAL_11652 [Tigriopus californicus]|uniref:S1 motif domain-containing protein n=1 Tax=Tigriopus californicus TaxID=6832 RepID=A0A553NTL4_TIGCA|nr:protein RRP5 homolog [Tigriopus californicus]TRY68763.1 hypothetical protein TCAL_11652 [Tigriopus californicus]|eukprot:TCALIF_11652-PA protein Name:"Similar to PDCD11 Protein RRP5 homolog (Bos taurus)" AED:0.03 eAED:0.05 QI:0/-1/0/1/-1/1/1/0/1432